MTTEEEAKRKWCPFVRVGSSTTGVGSLNRDWAQGVQDTCLCIGSNCMAWRWDEEWFQQELARRHRAAPGAGIQANAKEIETSGTKRGFCGLAGTP